MRATTDLPERRSARCARCGAVLGNADAELCPVRCDIGDPRRHFALFQAAPIGLAIPYVALYPSHLHAALSVVSVLNLIGIGLSIRDGAVVCRGGIIERGRNPVFFWVLVSLFTVPSIGYFAFMAYLHA